MIYVHDTLLGLKQSHAVLLRRQPWCWGRGEPGPRWRPLLQTSSTSTYFGHSSKLLLGTTKQTKTMVGNNHESISQNTPGQLFLMHAYIVFFIYFPNILDTNLSHGSALRLREREVKSQASPVTRVQR